MKKYELLLNETKEINGHTLYRIRALRDFSNVKKGDIGGWIEKESNLSHNGNCWVYHNACVYEEAWIYGNAHIFDNVEIYGHSVIYGRAKISGNSRISGNAQISGSAEIFSYVKISGDACISHDNHWMSMSSIGSENGTLTAYRQKDNSIGVTRGCFSGTLEEFAERVNQKHGDNKYGKSYRLYIEGIKIQLKNVAVK